MTNEEFKKIPFKYDGNGNPVTFGESGTFFTRLERRKIKRLIEKGYSVSEAMLTKQKLFCNSCVYFTRISGDIYCRRWQFALKVDSVACLKHRIWNLH